MVRNFLFIWKGFLPTLCKAFPTQQQLLGKNAFVGGTRKGQLASCSVQKIEVRNYWLQTRRKMTSPVKAGRHACQCVLVDGQESKGAAVTLRFVWPKALSPVTMAAEQKARLDLTVKCKWTIFLPLLTGLRPFGFLW